MSIRRAPRPDSNFYILDKSISEDKTLTWAARGMLVFLLGKPDNWIVSVQALINETALSRKQSGRDSVYAILAELKEAGYLRAAAVRSDTGNFGGVEYEVCETPSVVSHPHTDLPYPAQPHPARPLPANPTQTRTEEKQGLKPTKGVGAVPDYFDDFWKAWPKKDAKADAIKAFRQVDGPRHLPAILADIERRRTSEQWTKAGGSFIPLPASYLRGRRWEDEGAALSTAAVSWWQSASGIRTKAAELGVDILPGATGNAWLRAVASVWVAAGDGPWWDERDPAYPLAVAQRNGLTGNARQALGGFSLGVRQ